MTRGSSGPICGSPRAAGSARPVSRETSPACAATPTASGYPDPSLTNEPSPTRCVFTTLLHVDDQAESEGPTRFHDPAISRPCCSARSRGHPGACSDTLDQPRPRLRASHPRRRHSRLRGRHWSRRDEVRGEASLVRDWPTCSLSGRLASKRGAERASASHRPTSWTTDT